MGIEFKDSAFIREGTIGTGFELSSKPFEFKAGTDTLYIKGNCHINIAE